ncbi:MAG: hypothetical protein FWE24_05060 [Defluviitaleaceae bacterium]|nr:hypothetical protein [Defluviitaleaceae bacterium]
MLDWLVYVCLAVGAMLTLYSAIFLKPGKGAEEGGDINMERVERVLEVMDSADNTADELYKLSQDVVSEIDDKYQQLLYLYNMIDEKAAKLGSTGSIDISVDDSINFSKEKEKTKEIASRKGLNPNLINEKYRAVFDLYNKGNDIPEIARALSIGQGEVKLVLELGKGR